MRDQTSEPKRLRKSHNKSRNGCKGCKTRHSKCDEVHPTCGDCERLGLTCSFSATKSIAPSYTATPALAMDDLRLLHHWLKGPAALFADQDEQKAQQEREQQMEQAFAHPYLMHTILSIAALELFHKQPGETKYHSQATAHNVAALQQARPNVSRTDEKHGEAVYVFSALASLYAFAEPPLRLLTVACGRTPLEILQDLFNSFRMGRGIIAVMASNQDQLQKTGCPDKSMWPDEQSDSVSTLRVKFPQLCLLEELVQKYAAAELVSALLTALEELFASISILQQRPRNHSSARLIQTWPMHVDERLLAMWEAGNHIALIMLGNYAAAIGMRANIWFFQRWPELLLRCVEASLDSKWHSYLDWPKSVVVQYGETEQSRYSTVAKSDEGA